jgi:hypothetical protein
MSRNSNPPFKALIIVETHDEERLNAFVDFCVAADSKFSVTAHKGAFSSHTDACDVYDWLDHACGVLGVTMDDL